MSDTFSKHYDKIKRLKDELNAALEEAAEAKLGTVAEVDVIEHIKITGARHPVISIKMVMEVGL